MTPSPYEAPRKSDTPYPTRVDFTLQPELSAPWISSVLYIVGVLILLAGCFSGYAGFQESDSKEAAQGIFLGAGSIIGAFLFFGIAYGLHKLHQIEVHLRKS